MMVVHSNGCAPMADVSSGDFFILLHLLFKYVYTLKFLTTPEFRIISCNQCELSLQVKFIDRSSFEITKNVSN